MIYKGDLSTVFERKALSAYSLDNDLHEQALCFIHALDCDALSRLYAVGTDEGATVYIPQFRTSATSDAARDFCRALEDFLSSLDGALFGVEPYEESMSEALEEIECSLIFEAE